MPTALLPAARKCVLRLTICFARAVVGDLGLIYNPQLSRFIPEHDLAEADMEYDDAQRTTLRAQRFLPSHGQFEEDVD